jgi:hypothetical protein
MEGWRIAELLKDEGLPLEVPELRLRLDAQADRRTSTLSALPVQEREVI